MSLQKFKVTATILLLGLFGTTPAFSQTWGLGGFTWDKSSSSSNSGSNWGWGSKSSRYSTRVPKSYKQGTIIVSFGDRRLYHVIGRGRAVSYPIAIPKEKARWSGNFRVTRKQVNPTWTPTREMRVENPKLPLQVRGGDPLNPLGVRAIYVGNTLYRIHGTDAPWLIGKAVSHGCVRMYNKDVVHLYNRTRVGAPIIVTWKRFTS